MAKKKGGKKKKGKTSSKKRGKPSRPTGQKKAPAAARPVAEPMPEEIIEEPLDITEPETIVEPVEEEPEGDAKLSDAVSAVISDDGVEAEEKKEEKKKSPTRKKRDKLILKWAAEGYNVDELEELLDSGKTKGVKKAFDNFEADIKKVEVFRDELDSLDLVGMDSEVEAFMEMLTYPGDIENIEKEFNKLKNARRILEINRELDGMVLDSLKDRVESIREMLEDNLEEAENELLGLKKDYKEAYFEDGVEAFVSTDEKPKPTSKKAAAGNGKMPMEVKDIFLLYKDGKFISHHTARVVPKEEQEQLFADLKTGRNYLKSPNYKPQKLNVISVNNRKILVQGGQFTVIIMVVAGDVNPWTEKIIGKVQGLLEKEDMKALQSWNGDVASLKSAGKYMTALLYACMKLSKKK